MIGKGLPGWPKMNEEITNFNISQHTMAYRKANKNVKQLKAILEEGCVTCQIDLREVVAGHEVHFELLSWILFLTRFILVSQI